MGLRKDQLGLGAILRGLDRYWIPLTLLVWAGLSAWFLYERWGPIQGFGLGDTDDNLRMSQVRALLAGQDWFDLRQYRLNPPEGANVHWSRLVDLPLAGIILLFRPLVGGIDAERTAVAIAPLLPMAVLLIGVGLAVRRLIDPRAYGLAFLAFFFAGSASGMFVPLRIDHHGWQLALLSIAVAGIADPKARRGGLTLGIATALSLAIGLELLIYLALLGGAVVLFWIEDREERERLLAYAVTLAGGTALSFLLFASYANRLPVCDALSPVWLSNALLAGALLFVLAMLSPATWKQRLALALAAGAAVAAFHALAWPHCLSRLEGVSPEVEKLWLSRVREARPVYRHGWRLAVMISAIPIAGAIGWALLAWVNRVNRSLLRRTLAAAAPALAAALLLLWQTRTGPAAQVLGVVGTAALVWVLVPLVWKLRVFPLQLAGVLLVLLIGSGAAVPFAMEWMPAQARTPRDVAIGRANAQCNTLAAYRPVAQQPKGMVFSFVDYGPRIITVTHHSAVTGPYHRNGEQIADVMKAFRGSADQARAIMAKYRSDYLLICPNSSTTTIFMSEAPNGFYGQLQKGRVPTWLTPIDLPKDSPFRMWRVQR